MSEDKTNETSGRCMGCQIYPKQTGLYFGNCQHTNNKRTCNHCLCKQNTYSTTSNKRYKDDGMTKCKTKCKPVLRSIQVSFTGSQSDANSKKRPHRRTVPCQNSPKFGHRLGIFPPDASHAITINSLQCRSNNPSVFIIGNTLNTPDYTIHSQNAFKKPKRHFTTNTSTVLNDCCTKVTRQTPNSVSSGLQRISTKTVSTINVDDRSCRLDDAIVNDIPITDTASTAWKPFVLPREASKTTAPGTHVSLENRLSELRTEVPFANRLDNLLDEASETHNAAKDPKTKTKFDTSLSSSILETEMVTSTQCAVLSDISDHSSRNTEATVCTPNHKSVNFQSKQRPTKGVSSITTNSTSDGKLELDSMPSNPIGSNIACPLIDDSGHSLTVENSTGIIGINPRVPLLDIFLSEPDYPLNEEHSGQHPNTSIASLDRAYSEDKSLGEPHVGYICSTGNTKFLHSLPVVYDDLNPDLSRHRRSSVSVTTTPRTETVDRDRLYSWPSRERRTTSSRKITGTIPVFFVEPSDHQVAKRKRIERGKNYKQDKSIENVPLITITDDKSFSGDDNNNRKRVTSKPQDKITGIQNKAYHRKVEASSRKQGNHLNREMVHENIEVITITNDEESMNSGHSETVSKDQQIVQWLFDNKDEIAKGILQSPGHFETSPNDKQIVQQLFDNKDPQYKIIGIQHTACHRKAEESPRKQENHLNRATRHELVEVITMPDDEQPMSSYNSETLLKEKQIAKWLIDNKGEFLQSPEHFETSINDNQLVKRLLDNMEEVAEAVFVPENQPYLRNGQTETNHGLSRSTGGNTSPGISTDFQSLNLKDNHLPCFVNEKQELSEFPEHSSDKATTSYRRRSTSLPAIVELEIMDDEKFTENVLPDSQMIGADDTVQTITLEDVQPGNIQRSNSISSIHPIIINGRGEDKIDFPMTDESAIGIDNGPDYLPDIFEELDGLSDCMDNDGEEWADALEDAELTQAAIDSIITDKLTPLIKQELKHFIHYRRSKLGSDEDSLSTQSTDEEKIRNTTSDEEDKRWERKRALSKESAHRCRERQQSHEVNLIQTYKEFQNMNRTLETEIEQLTLEKKELDRLLSQHVCVKESKTQE